MSVLVSIVMARWYGLVSARYISMAVGTTRTVLVTLQWPVGSRYPLFNTWLFFFAMTSIKVSVSACYIAMASWYNSDSACCIAMTSWSVLVLFFAMTSRKTSLSACYIAMASRQNSDSACYIAIAS